jgi:hypothetical protein
MEALILFFVLIVAISIFCLVERKTVKQMREHGHSLTPKSYGIYLLKSGKDKYNKLRRKRIQKQRDKWNIG